MMLPNCEVFKGFIQIIQLLQAMLLLHDMAVGSICCACIERKNRAWLPVKQHSTSMKCAADYAGLGMSWCSVVVFAVQ